MTQTSSSHKAKARDNELNRKQTAVLLSCSELNSRMTVSYDLHVRMVERPLIVAFVCENIGLRPSNYKKKKRICIVMMI